MYGDIAHWFIEDLSKQVDMTGFEFDRYFPPEFYGSHSLERLFFWLCPFAAAIRRRKTSYTSITLGMIAEALETRKWTQVERR